MTSDPTSGQPTDTDATQTTTSDAAAPAESTGSDTPTTHDDGEDNQSGVHRAAEGDESAAHTGDTPDRPDASEVVPGGIPSTSTPVTRNIGGAPSSG